MGCQEPADGRVVATRQHVHEIHGSSPMFPQFTVGTGSSDRRALIDWLSKNVAERTARGALPPHGPPVPGQITRTAARPGCHAHRIVVSPPYASRRTPVHGTRHCRR
jgi:hypothetical protein